MNTVIREFVNNLHLPEAKKSNLTSSSAYMVNCPIPSFLLHELETTAELFDRDAAQLAGSLLTIAITEMLKEIPKKERDHIEQLTIQHEQQHIKQNEEALRFDAGGT